MNTTQHTTKIRLFLVQSSHILPNDSQSNRSHEKSSPWKPVYLPGQVDEEHVDDEDGEVQDGEAVQLLPHVGLPAPRGAAPLTAAAAGAPAARPSLKGAYIL